MALKEVRDYTPSLWLLVGIPSFGGVAGKLIETFFGAKPRLDVICRIASGPDLVVVETPEAG